MAETTQGRESEVFTQCTRLEQSLEDIEKSLTALEKRLESVLHIAVDECKEEPQPETALTPHATFLRRITDRIYHFAEMIDSLRDRTEL